MKLKKLGILLIVSVFLLSSAAVVGAQDTTSSASVPANDEQLVEAMSADGTWIIIFYDDFTTDEDLVMEGEHTNRGEVDRKLALYEQDSDRNLVARFTLEAPSITVRSPKTRFQNGTFKGDVYVESNNFALNDFTVDGDIYFETEEAKTTFTVNGGTEITGDLINNF
ncbi:MAG: hypothetical protein ACQEQH_08415 [Bacillota bacterium]